MAEAEAVADRRSTETEEGGSQTDTTQVHVYAVA